MTNRCGVHTWGSRRRRPKWLKDVVSKLEGGSEGRSECLSGVVCSHLKVRKE